MAVDTPVLTSLPTEILLLISKPLNAHELVRLSRTCRSLCHLGGCKSVAKAFMRRKSADDAIEYLSAKVNRTDLVAELFRHTEFCSLTYNDVAEIAARLNDLKQLEAWHDEFGFIPSDALYGAARSTRIETFDFLLPRVALDHGLGFTFFHTIGTYRNRALLDHLQKTHTDLVTREGLIWILGGAECGGDAGLDFALEIFDSLTPRRGELIAACALGVTKTAAACGNHAVFSEFIAMFQYDEDGRDGIAESAAGNNRADILRLQDESRNRASSFHPAILDAIDNNAAKALKYMLDMEGGVWDRIERDDLVDPFMAAVEHRHRSATVRLLMVHVPPVDLLRGAEVTESLATAVLLLKEYQRRMSHYKSSDSDEYSADVVDWKTMVRLVIMCIDGNASALNFDIEDDERALYRNVLPAAIDLARELGIRKNQIAHLKRFVRE